MKPDRAFFLFYLFGMVKFLSMIKHKSDLNIAGIIIPTMNRPDFVIRQLNYYASVKCPHTIYVGDSSDDEYAQKLQKEIEIKRKFLEINYWQSPKPGSSSAQSMVECMHGLCLRVKEKYACFAGDDDYQIPSSVSKCIEFLENNPDYSSASGYAVSFRLKKHGVYGELGRLADYPRRNIEALTAAERILNFMANYYVPLFSVYKTKLIKECWSRSIKLVKNWEFSTEIMPSALLLISGKAKILDFLGFVRQIHSTNHQSPNTFDWATQPIWLESYDKFEKIISDAIVEHDGVAYSEAKRTARLAFWSYFQMWLAKDYKNNLLKLSADESKGGQTKNIRNLVATRLPFLKKIYREFRLLFSNKKQIHYEVLQPTSKYYKDFKPVMDSFTGIFRK